MSSPLRPRQESSSALRPGRYKRSGCSGNDLTSQRSRCMSGSVGRERRVPGGNPCCPVGTVNIIALSASSAVVIASLDYSIESGDATLLLPHLLSLDPHALVPYVLVLHLIFDPLHTWVIGPCCEGRRVCSQILLSQTGNEGEDGLQYRSSLWLLAFQVAGFPVSPGAVHPTST